MIIKKMRMLLVFTCCLMSQIVLAQENASEKELAKSTIVEASINQQDPVIGGSTPHRLVKEEPKLQGILQQSSVPRELVNTPPEVGKHVMAMDAGSMILSLLMVLALIIVCAFVLKRFTLTQQSVSQLKIVTSLSLGSKERVVVVQAGDQQLLLGVTAQQVTLIERLAEPLATQTLKTTELPKSLLSFLLAKKP
jgi:flagellar protein FliO/FliZ